jgi:hypothetical protein
MYFKHYTLCILVFMNSSCRLSEAEEKEKAAKASSKAHGQKTQATEPTESESEDAGLELDDLQDIDTIIILTDEEDTDTDTDTDISTETSTAGLGLTDDQETGAIVGGVVGGVAVIGLLGALLTRGKGKAKTGVEGAPKKSKTEFMDQYYKKPGSTILISREQGAAIRKNAEKVAGVGDMSLL